jgi:hypothetical protein
MHLRFSKVMKESPGYIKKYNFVIKVTRKMIKRELSM